MEEKHLIEMGIVIGRRLKFLKVLASLKSKSRYEEREKSLWKGKEQDYYTSCWNCCYRKCTQDAFQQPFEDYELKGTALTITSVTLTMPFMGKSCGYKS